MLGLLAGGPRSDVLKGGRVASGGFLPAAALPLAVAGDALAFNVRDAVRAEHGQAGPHERAADALAATIRLDVEPFYKAYGRRPADGARRHFPHETPHGRAVAGQHGDQSRIDREPRRVARRDIRRGLLRPERWIGGGKGRLMLIHEPGEEVLQVPTVPGRGGANDKAHARPPAISFGRGGRPRRRLGGAGGGAASREGAGAAEAVGLWESTAGRSVTPAWTAASGSAWCTR